MSIDWTFKVSDIISLIGFVGGGLIFILMIKGDVRALGMRVDFLKQETERQNTKIDKQAEEIAKLGSILVVMGRYEERMIAVQKDLDDLRHGRGFVIPRNIDFASRETG